MKYGDPIDAPQQRNATELRVALEHVTRQIIEVEAVKKASAKDYNDRLKDLREERDAIVEQLGQLEEPE